MLDSLPQSLYETYDRMLSNIDSTCAEYARRVLTLLCCAKRPLTVPELIDGVAVELGDVLKFNSKRRLQNVDAIHEVCPGFIEIDMQLESDQATVRIAHFSVQEYLESPQRSGKAFSVRGLEAHAEIASICLTYLLEPALSTSSEPAEELPLAVYAAKHWHEHYHKGDATLYGVELQALRLFRDAGGKLTNWLRIWDVDTYSERYTEKMPSAVYYASLLGLSSVVSKLLSEESFDRLDGGPIPPNVSDLVNVRTGSHGFAITAAAYTGHEAVVRLLLDEGADVNVQGRYFGTALQAASLIGHEVIVRLLLDRGADVNVQGGLYGTALQAASLIGHEVIVRLLLDRGADINIQGGEYGTALQAALVEGHEAVVRLLLDKGADINVQGGYFGTALQAASYRGHEVIVRLLLDRGADVNVQGGEYGTALQAASYEGYEAVVRLLLDKGADINVQGGRYGTALLAALVEGDEAIVRLLLDRGADVNIQGGYFGTALQAASYRGHEVVVRLLLDKGADVNVQGGEYKTALQAASYRGHEVIVRLLLDKGADINV
jgi:ankyrin repeat protein